VLAAGCRSVRGGRHGCRSVGTLVRMATRRCTASRSWSVVVAIFHDISVSADAMGFVVIFSIGKESRLEVSVSRDLLAYQELECVWVLLLLFFSGEMVKNNLVCGFAKDLACFVSEGVRGVPVCHSEIERARLEQNEKRATSQIFFGDEEKVKI
jgi:hypothetical protein